MQSRAWALGWDLGRGWRLLVNRQDLVWRDRLRSWDSYILDAVLVYISIRIHRGLHTEICDFNFVAVLENTRQFSWSLNEQWFIKTTSVRHIIVFVVLDRLQMLYSIFKDVWVLRDFDWAMCRDQDLTRVFIKSLLLAPEWIWGQSCIERAHLVSQWLRTTCFLRLRGDRSGGSPWTDTALSVLFLGLVLSFSFPHAIECSTESLG